MARSALNSSKQSGTSRFLNSFLEKLGLDPKDRLKLFSMSALMFCILCNQSFLRVLKDGIVVSELNAEITAFIKLYCVLPCAALFVLLYNKVADSIAYTKVYYSIISAFIAFILLFAFFLYPNASSLHISPELRQVLGEQHPNLKWYILLFGEWTYTLFYTVAELWPDVTYVFLFWQLANHITQTAKARSFYPTLAIFGNSSVVLSGLVLGTLSSQDCWVYSVFGLAQTKFALMQVCSCIIAIMGFFSMYLVHFISVKVVKDPNLYIRPPAQEEKAKLVESLVYVKNSRYLWLIVACSTAFYFGINLVEVLWKAKLRELCPNVEDYSKVASMCVTCTGIVTTLMSVVSKSIMQRLSLRTILLIAPVIMVITGIAFFSVAVLPGTMLLGLSALQLAVLTGALQNILAKGVKYSIWDTSKEILYIPLDQATKTKGKAAADLVGSKLGKSISSLMPVALLSASSTASYISTAPLIAVVFALVSVAWVVGAIFLSKEYHKVVDPTKSQWL